MKLVARDLKDTVKFCLLYVCSYLLPERRWPGLCRLLARIELKLNAARTAAHGRVYAEALADGEDTPAIRQIELRKASERYRDQMDFAACYRFYGWAPKLHLQGAHYLDQALGAGRGVILWESNFIHSSLITKMALADHGYQVHHLSHPWHGPSGTEFGRRVINPLARRIEDRYLAERIMLDQPASHQQYLQLMARLRENRIVSIRAVPRAKQMFSLPFLNGTLKLPKGPVMLSELSGAPLLLVVTVPSTDGGFETRIAAPESSGVRDQQGRDVAVIERMAALLEANVRANPHLWRDWASFAS
jgi:lauroyl/myristoyl acyltransferase